MSGVSGGYGDADGTGSEEGTQAMTNRPQSAESDARRSRPQCTAFLLDNVCVASDPCPVHGCDDTNDGSTAKGCFCDLEREA